MRKGGSVRGQFPHAQGLLASPQGLDLRLTLAHEQDCTPEVHTTAAPTKYPLCVRLCTKAWMIPLQPRFCKEVAGAW